LNTHPDYLLDPVTWNVYADFLRVMSERQGYWHALPREVARWWRARGDASAEAPTSGEALGTVELTTDGIRVTCPDEF